MFKTKKIKLEKNSKKKEKENKKEIVANKAQDEFLAESFDKPIKQKKTGFWRVFWIAVIVSLLLGFINILFFSFGFYNDLLPVNVESNLENKNVFIEKEKEVILKENEKIDELAEKTNKSLVAILKKNKDNIYDSSDLISSGVIISNDGWLVTVADINKNNIVLSNSDGMILSVDKVLKDEKNDLSFIKVKESDINFSAIDFASFNEINLLDLVFLNFGNKNIFLEQKLSRISSFNNFSQDLIKSSEEMTSFIRLQDNFARGIVFGMNEKMIGIIKKTANENVVLPAEYVANSFKKIIDSENNYSYLGIEYINLKQTVNLKYGYMGAKIERIKVDSPLLNTDVREGDIIIQINNVVLNGKNDLADVMQKYSSGDKVKFVVLDEENGEEMDIEVILK
jgi:S1-C subfamily serine protease